MVGLWTSKLFDAVCYYYTYIRNLLFNRAPIDSVDQDGRTCLHIAALDEKWNDLVVLLQRITEIYSRTQCKEIIDQRDNFGRKAITYAIENNNLAAVKRLVAAGATTGQEELFEAVDVARFLNSNIVKYLLTTMKLPVNCYDMEGDTPLSHAALKGPITLVKYLLEMGADVNTVKKNGLLPLTSALIEATEDDTVCYDTVDLLLNWGADVNKSNDAGDTPLIYCAKHDYIEAIRKLLSLNADPNRINSDGMSALAAAAEKGCLDSIKILIEKGTIINPMSGKLPLICAVQNNKLEIVKYLVAKGANVNKVDSKGNSPLLSAVRTDNYEMIKWLLDNGARFLIHSVFLESVSGGNVEIIEMLIEEGAKVNLKYKNGSTPLLTAIEAKRLDVVDTLLAHGADINLEGKKDGSAILPFKRLLEMDLTDAKFNKIVKTFIDKGADVNVKTINGFPLLTKYAQLDDYEMVQYLVSKGANVNEISDSQYAPLVIAAQNMNFQMFDYLVNCNADIEQVREQLDKIALINDSFAIFLEELSNE